MKFRKSLLTIILVGLIALSMVGCSSSEPAKTDAPAETAKAAVIKLRFATNLPVSHTVTIGYQAIADAVKEKTDGQIEITIFPSEQLGKEKDVTDAIANATGDMSGIGPGEMARRYAPALIFDAPYIFNGPEHLLAFANGEEGKKLWDEQAEQTNIRNLGMLYYGTREVTSNVEINTPADMAGFKLRVPDQPMPLAYGKGLGAKPTPMAFGEVYLSLQQGVVDGQENPVPTIVSNKFNEVQDYLIKTNHVVAAVGIIISEEKYQSIPDDLRAILDEEVAKGCEQISNNIRAEEESLIEELKAEGMTIIEPDVDAFKESCSFIYDEYKSKWGENLYDTIQSVEY